MIKYKYNVNTDAIERDDEFFAYLNVVDAYRIVNELNTLYKENQKLLTLSNMKKGALVEAVKDLIKEKEELKYINGIHRSALLDSEYDMKKLEEKNEQLKQELFDRIKYTHQLEAELKKLR